MTHLSNSLRTPHRLTLLERLLLNVLTESIAERDGLLRQARAARVHWEQTNGQPALIFDVPSDMERVVTDGLVAEAQAFDVDGSVIHILMHVHHGVLSIIAFHREDGNPIIALPEASSVHPEW